MPNYSGRAIIKWYLKMGTDNWPNLRRFINQFMKVGGVKTWKELMIGVQQLVRLHFNDKFIKNPDLSFNGQSKAYFMTVYVAGAKRNRAATSLSLSELGRSTLFKASINGE